MNLKGFDSVMELEVVATEGGLKCVVKQGVVLYLVISRNKE